MERVLWYLIAGTRGGHNRARILQLLARRPSNAHQIAEDLDLNYKTVTHHLDLLSKHDLVVKALDDAYASPYFLSKMMEHFMPQLEELLQEVKEDGSH